MARPDKTINVHESFFTKQAKVVKAAISEIMEKDSLSVGDTKAVRILTDVYDSLSNLVPENYEYHPADCNNDRSEESQ